MEPSNPEKKAEILHEVLTALGKFIRYGSTEYRANHKDEYAEILAMVESGECRFAVRLDEVDGTLQLGYYVLPVIEDRPPQPMFFLALRGKNSENSLH